MQRSIYKNIVLDTIAASGADVVVTNRKLYIAGEFITKLDDVVNVEKKVAITSETAGVVTFSSPTVVNDKDYTLTLTQPNPNAEGAAPNPIVYVYTVHTPATGSVTATTLYDQFRAAINADLASHVTPSGTTTLICTADSGYPVLIGSSVNAGTCTQTTQGIAKFGVPATLDAFGAKGYTGDTYTMYYFFDYNLLGESNTMRQNQGTQVVLWANEDEGGYAAFVAELDDALSADSGYTASELEVNG